MTHGPYDAVVIGGGASGLAAATWLARFRRAVLVVDSGDYRATAVQATHGYLGRDPLKPTDFLAGVRDDVLRYPTARYVSGRVSAVSPCETGFRVRYHGPDGDESVEACRLVLATGTADALPEIDGLAEHYGVSAFHCPACDGYEARDRDVVAVGWDARLTGFATTLLDWACSVTIVSGGRRFEGDETHCAALDRLGVEIVEERATSLVGERGALRGLRLSSGRVLPASLLFFSVAHQPRSELAVSLGCGLDEEGYVAVDAQGATTVPGVYAAGDLVPGLQLVQVAAAKGTVAGVAAAMSLHGEPGSPMSPEPAPDLEAVSDAVSDAVSEAAADGR